MNGDVQFSHTFNPEEIKELVNTITKLNSDVLKMNKQILDLVSTIEVHIPKYWGDTPDRIIEGIL